MYAILTREFILCQVQRSKFWHALKCKGLKFIDAILAQVNVA